MIIIGSRKCHICGEIKSKVSMRKLRLMYYNWADSKRLTYWVCVSHDVVIPALSGYLVKLVEG